MQNTQKITLVRASDGHEFDVDLLEDTPGGFLCLATINGQPDDLLYARGEYARKGDDSPEPSLADNVIPTYYPADGDALHDSTPDSRPEA